MPSLDSFKSKRTLTVGSKTYTYFSLSAAAENGLGDVSRLPASLKVLLENMLRHEDGKTVTKDDILAFKSWLENKGGVSHEIAYRPARVLMQDFTGVPAVVDLAAMRDAAQKLGASADAINPQVPVDLVIDHSVMVDSFGGENSFEKNVEIEYKRNQERYEFLRWGSTAFKNFRVVPPGTGICHQVNLEYLGQTVWTKDEDGETVAYPDTCVGTDSHTTMINGLAVLGWGVGGIEAEAAMLGQPVSMLIPEVIGFRLDGKMAEGATATDLVLTVVQMLRAKGVVGKFVEFYGPGLSNLTLEDQATISNMAPEYGATCGFFPVDEDTVKYLTNTGRDAERVALVEAYAKAQGYWRPEQAEPIFTDTLELDLGAVVPSISGPKRPQDRVLLSEGDTAFAEAMAKEFSKAADAAEPIAVEGKDYTVTHGDVFIAAITSCTNTSNPSVLIAAGLVAKKARELGLNRKPWVKTSLAPGSQVVTDYLDKAGLSDELDALGFNLVGYGCTTCIGNSGPLEAPLAKAIADGDLVSCSVLSGNRNFEGRIGPDIKANYLASPPLVVAYAIAGSLRVNLTTDPLGKDKNGNDVFLKDIWPTSHEIAEIMSKAVTPQMFAERYSDVFKGDEHWQGIEVSGGQTYSWPPASTYVQNPPYFEGMGLDIDAPADVENARVLALFGDSITTDHISPAGSIKASSPAGVYLQEHQVSPLDFNSYGSRRGNHEVMMRGTFANIRIKNQMVPGVEGGVTVHYPDAEQMPIYDAAMKYEAEGTPLVVFAGDLYGNGSSRDWAAKGTVLLGVRAVIAGSFERIHRSNLIGMGVLPLEFADGESAASLGLTGKEQVTIKGIDSIKPRQTLAVEITREDGTSFTANTTVRIDTENELDYYRNGGILHYVLRNLARAAA
ncbi:MAG: aconitate hydratase AcnA [Hyphomonas sp.]|jgi:aconitate hydratase|uniref:(2R,3S)-2-methylisocitrate dehydratase n=3 Tax=root TaxID=1 RepID=A0A160U3W0_9ZZZZ|nr:MULTISPECIES: aconitate hydratase AcnA [unclassified Hyphomonas]MAN90541.1 aconitate hydratase AcnA [Hyphomonadaceae bacterium]MAA81516.1 aconitate hydratase AcnA [Hyphomonas sp.]MBG67568.1 aconitate hydratase AcnA [Hyphomonas sp.]MBO6583875.1 aconitate hydratase AcnA [Hyphomonas sp.]QSR20818.1 aconitate hydratase 1 [Hyphomonas sp. KY3]|tara:strand:- start:156434 stop:159121 length:2688 start_codon:yes stop_codon:yes gene_type:complete